MGVDEFSYEMNMLPLIFLDDTGCGAALPLSRRLLFIIDVGSPPLQLSPGRI